ncbi:hypothetical protein LWI28_018693 [Acer negundo]|uniref:Uncharacterized protein n=1 Tax=Acer negundo TaxID=4023 RepID=A0AAD5NK27_ACENE|nr:hypothetical protein LWI28_018693 [Acer negundo]
MSDPKDVAAFYLPLEEDDGVEDDDRWYSEAALHDDVNAEGGFEEGVPRGGTSRNSVERILSAIKTSQDANQAAIQEVRKDMQQQFATMDDNWRFDMTELRRELGLSIYSRQRRSHTASAPSAAPVGTPIIDEGSAMRRVMELSRQEAADRAVAKKDPKGKRVV